MHNEETNMTETCNIIKGLKAEESQDTYEQSNILLKNLNPIICEWISILINKSLSECNFPNCLKIFKISTSSQKWTTDRVKQLWTNNINSNSG